MFFFFTVGLLRAFNMLLFIGTLIGEGRKVVLFVLFCWQSFLALARYPAQFLPSPPSPRSIHETSFYRTFFGKCYSRNLHPLLLSPLP